MKKSTIVLYVLLLVTPFTKAPSPTHKQKVHTQDSPAQAPAQGLAAEPKKHEPTNAQETHKELLAEAEKALGSGVSTVNIDFETFRIDPEAKRKEIVYLVKDGIDFLISHRPEEAFNAFINNRRFTKGEVSLFVIDVEGNVYVPEEGLISIWDNVKEYKNNHGTFIYKNMIDKAEKGGGWFEYERQNDYKSSYIEKIEKNGISYVIGAGWYPSSKNLEVESLVKSAVAYFYKFGQRQAFSEFSNEVGQFVRGDLYIFSYDLNGYCVAHGGNIALIGRDLINLKDDNGLLLVKALIEQAKKGSGWIPYQWQRAPKIAYVELVTDNTGSYVIGAGYYPETNRTNVAFMVKRAAKYFNAWGKEKAIGAYRMKNGEFVQGDLSIFMYDFTGNILAQGDNPVLVGQNMMDLRASDGSYTIQDLIGVAQKGGGWVSFEWKNDLMLAYIEKISDADGSYLIGSGYFPDTKRQKVERLVKSAVGFFKNHSFRASMQSFKDNSGLFILGSFDIFVFNMEGDCLVYGNEPQLIWKNIKNASDMEGKKIFRLLHHQAEQEPGWVIYKSKNDTKFAYVEKVIKNGVPYIIGSAFYK